MVIDNTDRQGAVAELSPPLMGIKRGTRDVPARAGRAPVARTLTVPDLPVRRPGRSLLPPQPRGAEGCAGRAPLAGLAFGAKDVFHIAGTPTGFGHPAWLATHEPPRDTATAVQRLLDAGADLVGKTHTDELAYSLTGENVHYGTPVNAACSRSHPRRLVQRFGGGGHRRSGRLRDRHRLRRLGAPARRAIAASSACARRSTACRSMASSPSAALRRGRLVRARRGRAGEGRPCAPGRRFGAGAAAPVAPRRRRFRDGGRDGGRRTGWSNRESGGSRRSGRGRHRRAGRTGESWFDTFRILQGPPPSGPTTAPGFGRRRPDFGPGVRERFEWAEALGGDAVEAARPRLDAIRARIAEVWWGRGTSCVFPPRRRVAPLKNTPVDDIEIRYRHQAMHLLCIAGLGGLPQISLPMAELGGLPLGLSLNGPRGADMRLLGLARRLMPEGPV